MFKWIAGFVLSMCLLVPTCVAGDWGILLDYRSFEPGRGEYWVGVRYQYPVRYEYRGHSYIRYRSYDPYYYGCVHDVRNPYVGSPEWRRRNAHLVYPHYSRPLWRRPPITIFEGRWNRFIFEGRWNRFPNRDRYNRYDNRREQERKQIQQPVTVQKREPVNLERRSQPKSPERGKLIPLEQGKSLNMDYYAPVVKDGRRIGYARKPARDSHVIRYTVPGKTDEIPSGAIQENINGPHRRNIDKQK